MLILGINSAATQTEIALIQIEDRNSNGGRILLEKSWISERNEAEKLLPALQKALKKYSFPTFAKGILERIFVVSGPGSFSGLRVGVTIANALAFSQKIPMFSATTFEIMKLKITAVQRKSAAIIISAGGTKIAVVTPGKKSPVQMELQDLSTWLKNKKSIHSIAYDLRPDTEKNLMKLLKNFPKIKSLSSKKCRTFGQALQEFFQNSKKPRAVKMVKPVYLQKPTITQSKKPLFN